MKLLDPRDNHFHRLFENMQNYKLRIEYDIEPECDR